jgi:hypothetical protein
MAKLSRVGIAHQDMGIVERRHIRGSILGQQNDRIELGEGASDPVWCGCH